MTPVIQLPDRFDNVSYIHTLSKHLLYSLFTALKAGIRRSFVEYARVHARTGYFKFSLALRSLAGPLLGRRRRRRRRRLQLHFAIYKLSFYLRCMLN